MENNHSCNQKHPPGGGLAGNSASGGRLCIVKVGGAVVEDETKLARLIDDFSAIDCRKVLVHGGGRTATRLASALGIETSMVGGRRITDAAMLKIVTMVYGGLVNKNLVARLQARGVNALGLTGADMNVIRSHRRPLLNDVDYGFVGDVDEVDGSRLCGLVESGVVPVVAPLTHDGRGNILNTNADTIASETAKALARYYDVTLVYAFEKPGVLRNPSDDDSVIPIIRRAEFDHYVVSGVVAGGMVPKLQNAFAAVDAGVDKVIITRADAIDGLHGTIISK